MRPWQASRRPTIARPTPARPDHRRAGGPFLRAAAAQRPPWSPGRARRWPAAPPRAGRSPSRRRSGSATGAARRSRTSTATSTSTCTAGTACRWPATPTRRSSRRSPSGSPAAPTSPSRPRTPSSSPRSWPARFGLPLWRFGNSGTEATMDAVHLMRAATGRDLIIKVEGCYHGHHDSVQVSVLPEADEARPGRRAGRACPATPASRRRSSTWSRSSPFNDLDAVERVLDEHPGRDRRHDPRADHDERRDHPARRRLPRRPQRPAARRTARCSPSTR